MPAFVLLLIVAFLLVTGTVLVTAVRRAANVGLLFFVAGGIFLFIALPWMMSSQPEEVYDWMSTAKYWFGYVVLAMYLAGLGTMLIYVYSPAFDSNAEDVGLCGIAPNTSATTQTPASWVSLVLGWVLVTIAVLVMLYWIGSNVFDTLSWFTRPTVRTLVARMQDLDAHTKKDEFKATLDPLFFTIPKRLMTKGSQESWQKVAQRKAEKEGKYVIEDVESIKFYSQDGRNLTHARLHFKGKLDGKDYAGRITVERKVFPEDQHTIARIVYKINDELPQPAASSGKSSIDTGKVIAPVPDPFTVDKD